MCRAGGTHPAPQGSSVTPSVQPAAASWSRAPTARPGGKAIRRIDVRSPPGPRHQPNRSSRHRNPSCVDEGSQTCDRPFPMSTMPCPMRLPPDRPFQRVRVSAPCHRLVSVSATPDAFRGGGALDRRSSSDGASGRPTRCHADRSNSTGARSCGMRIGRAPMVIALVGLAACGDDTVAGPSDLPIAPVTSTPSSSQPTTDTGASYESAGAPISSAVSDGWPMGPRLARSGDSSRWRWAANRSSSTDRCSLEIVDQGFRADTTATPSAASSVGRSG